jgi:DNA-nicking Smr family endonuclease
MASRSGGKRPLPPDFHLWREVTGSVLPLRPRRRRQVLDATLPVPAEIAVEAKAPRLKINTMPSYRPPGTPGPAPSGTIEPKLRRKLGRGQIAIDGTLDLHGMHQDEARAALGRFVVARAERGDRTVLVITGKGLKKINGDPTTIIERGVLRTMLPIWLNAPELKPFVIGWDQAAQGHGGEGAWYVRLRRVIR